MKLLLKILPIYAVRDNSFVGLYVAKVLGFKSNPNMYGAKICIFKNEVEERIANEDIFFTKRSAEKAIKEKAKNKFAGYNPEFVKLADRLVEAMEPGQIQIYTEAEYIDVCKYGPNSKFVTASGRN